MLYWGDAPDGDTAMCRWKLALFALGSFALGAVVGPRLGGIPSQKAHAAEEQVDQAKGFLDLSKYEIRNAKPVDFVEGPSLYYVAHDADSARPLMVCVAKLKMHGEVRRKGQTSWRGATYHQICMCASSHGKLPTKDELYFGPKDEPSYVGNVPESWLNEWNQAHPDRSPATVREWLDWAESQGHAVPEAYRRRKS
jgi:hypothetical protein